MLCDSWDLGVKGPKARLLLPLAVLKRDVAGLNVIETKGVVDVDVVLAGGLGEGVVVNQLRTLLDLSCISQGRGSYLGHWVNGHGVVLAFGIEVHGVCVCSAVEDIAHPIVGGDEDVGTTRGIH